MIATVGSDSICKIWDISVAGESEPKHIFKRDLKQGELFSV